LENDDVTVGRILTRREALRIAAWSGLGLAALGGARRAGYAAPLSHAPSKAHLVASPVLTEGPFFVDENLKRSDLVAGATRHSVKNGIPLQVGFTVYRLSAAGPALLKGAHIDVWHADAIGVYSDENNPMNHEVTSRQTWLRGYQVTDEAGSAGFKTIFPGWYPGRTPHIHFKIRTYTSATRVTAEFTSQLFFKDADAERIYTVDPYTLAGQRDTNNANDSIFNERQRDGSVAGEHLLLDLQKRSGATGYRAHFTVVLTDQNLHAGRGSRPGGPPFGGPPPDGGFGGPPLDGPPPDGGFGGPPPGNTY
jgi:protocatechuate 3,4-dioxygenase beta subunit